jgi:hypothetical protein
MPWFPNPFTLTHAAREARRVLSGGGPKVMRLTGVTQPEGVIFPTSAVCLEVEARDRTVVRFAPEIPVHVRTRGATVSGAVSSFRSYRPLIRSGSALTSHFRLERAAGRGLAEPNESQGWLSWFEGHHYALVCVHGCAKWRRRGSPARRPKPEECDHAGPCSTARSLARVSAPSTRPKIAWRHVAWARARRLLPSRQSSSRAG